MIPSLSLVYVYVNIVFVSPEALNTALPVLRTGGFYVESIWVDQNAVVVRTPDLAVPLLLALPGIQACFRRKDLER